ncbi:TetR/AcrR family transcriptional regulator [Paucibacter soli]|uniref:TetR/AcrR family transcriptional regulator n=1 Tax=Paucibacter soli TaxID=3133433 RepID=UPI0030AD942F
MPPKPAAGGSILPAEERRELTVETVIELAAEQNPNDITTAAIAARMGVTQGALFRHFSSKDAILQAVVGWVSERLLARVDEALAAAHGPAAALEAVFMVHIAFVSKHPGAPRLLFGELQRQGDSTARRMVQTLMQGYRARLMRVLADGQLRGAFDPDLDQEAAATLFIGCIQGLVMQSLMSGRVADLRKQAQRVFPLYLRGLLNPAGPA